MAVPSSNPGKIFTGFILRAPCLPDFRPEARPWAIQLLRCSLCQYNTFSVNGDSSSACENCGHPAVVSFEYYPAIKCWACNACVSSRYHHTFWIIMGKTTCRCRYPLDNTSVVVCLEEKVGGKEIMGAGSKEVDIDKMWVQWQRRNRVVWERTHGGLRKCVEVDKGDMESISLR